MASLSGSGDGPLRRPRLRPPHPPPEQIPITHHNMENATWLPVDQHRLIWFVKTTRHVPIQNFNIVLWGPLSGHPSFSKTEICLPWSHLEGEDV